jgi:two-component system chemotaxis response regulator CheB
VAAPPAYGIAVAASAGGVEALRTLVASLPEDLDAAVCIVLHIPSSDRSMLAPILDRESALPVVLAEDGARLERGKIYVARAARHLLIRVSSLELNHGPKENGVRPAADPLFRSLAGAWGACGIAVVLSGALDDGAAGAAAVVAAGGRLVVQDPADALVPSMPASAIAAARPDAVLPVAAIGDCLARMVASTPPTQREEQAMSQPEAEEFPPRPPGPASGFVCPQCHGPLWELREDDVLRYRCRVGHAYSEQAMIDAQGDAVEAALWAALEALQERSELLHRVADRVDDKAPRSRDQFRKGARDADERAAIIRRVLTMGDALREQTG